MAQFVSPLVAVAYATKSSNTLGCHAGLTGSTNRPSPLLAPLAREHWDVEQVLQQSAMSWTILRPHAFMQNWLGDLAAGVRRERIVHAAIGDGRVPFIDARDIADVALAALLHAEQHAGQSYLLTGGEAVGYEDLAAALTQVLGQVVTYRALSLDEERARLEGQGVAPAAIESMLALAAYQRAGGATERTHDAVERVLGRPPRNLDDFARDYRERFVARTE